MMTIDILISGESLGQNKIIETTTLLDTGAGGKFIDQNFVWNQKIKTKELKYPIKVFNVDGTSNKWGTITKYTQLDLTINGQTWTHNLLVTVTIFYLTFCPTLHSHSIFSFSDFTYIISLIPGHESCYDFDTKRVSTVK
jgi:Retroviral aspartyl protease